MLTLHRPSAKHTLTSLALAISTITTGLCHGDTTGNDRLFPLSKVGGQSVEERPSLSRQLVLKSPQATRDQVDPLRKSASINFEAADVTIRQATNRILRSTGYELLESGGTTSDLLSELLDSPLPHNLRSFYHLHIYEMLRAIGGVGFVPVFDHLHRKVTFDPKPLYVGLGSTPTRDVPETTRTVVPVIPDEDLSYSSPEIKPTVGTERITPDISPMGDVSDTESATTALSAVPENTVDTSKDLNSDGTDVYIEDLQQEYVPVSDLPLVPAVPVASSVSNAESIAGDHSAHVINHSASVSSNLSRADSLIDTSSAATLTTTTSSHELQAHQAVHEYERPIQRLRNNQTSTTSASTPSDTDLINQNSVEPDTDVIWQVVGSDNFAVSMYKDCAKQKGSNWFWIGCN